ncbi:hypothetical protein Poli38472_007837 [Pythium oligandrum]|uniref:TFIIS N-terminal domain-containing protein n=1 Tax=Pythium oligandrum TaxID=41045 RepID=A0A8K1CT03_PYTOL|nr:hypothetical protein Poli38472_007837 [Pythium oligandrum]|eukprot:TMW68165.1 hypothetical protein Poli38472_007837 [Pythium oligandrum]
MALSTTVAPPPANSVGWYILEGYPWWPVYVCDQFKLRPKLHLLGDGHRKILKKAREFPQHYALVYYFGSYTFSLVPLNKNVLRPWDCDEREMFLKGHPKHLAKKGTMDELQASIHEVEEYLAEPEDMRVPPQLVPSDLDPSLEPPPPIEIPAVVEDSEEGEGNDDDEEMASDDNADEEDEDMNGSDEDDKKKKKAKKPTKKKEKKTKEAASPKKKASKKKTDNNEPKKSPKKKKATGEKTEKKPATKRSRPDAAQNGEPSAEASPSKKAKKEKTPSAKVDKSATKSSTVPAGDDEEDLTAVLEKEIRWILDNCQFEEMTTKTVRKMLEKRLKRDLRAHKTAIRTGVERVIAQIEQEEGADTNDKPAEQETAIDVKAEDVKQEGAPSPVKTEVSPPAATTNEEPVAVVKDEKKEDVKVDEVQNEAVKEEPKEEPPLHKLKNAKTDLTLAGGDHTKVTAVLDTLQKLEGVSSTDLTESGIVPLLVELRAHRKHSIGDTIGDLAKKWEVEDLIPAPKPVDEADILKLKEKLIDSKTSHEELLVCLTELEQMPLEIDHLKKTGISRAVANLRQHANDKVSITAKNLRNAWMRLVDQEKPGQSQDRGKKLENMNQVLSQNADGDSDLAKSQQNVLEKLYKMSLSVQEIIDSKIGITVSKLRKSSHENVAHAALKLRKKWKNEAGSQ